MALKTDPVVTPSSAVETSGAPDVRVGRAMAAPKNLRILPGGRINGLSDRMTRGGSGRLLIRRPPGPILFLGATTYAAAYLSLGLAGLSMLSGLLAVAGTIVILFGLRRTWAQE